jgi:hypothetical protein
MTVSHDQFAFQNDPFSDEWIKRLWMLAYEPLLDRAM